MIQTATRWWSQRNICLQYSIEQYTDGSIIEGEEEQKLMAARLKRTGITRYAPNFSDMLFMIIEMASPKGFSHFILKAEKYAKNCPKIVTFVHSDFERFLPISRV